jgi:hypothetical protein
VAKYGRMCGQAWKDVWPSMEGSVAKYGRKRGQVWKEAWPSMEGSVAKYGRKRGVTAVSGARGVV